MNNKTIIANGGKVPDTHIQDLDVNLTTESFLEIWEIIQPKFNEELAKRFSKCIIYCTMPIEESNNEWLKDLFYNPKSCELIPFDNRYLKPVDANVSIKKT